MTAPPYRRVPAEEEKPHEIDHGVARRLFKEYVRAKKAAGQSTKGLSYGKMLAKLSAEAGRLKQKLGDDVGVRFEVKTVDGRVRLRALRDKATPAPSKTLAPPPVPAPSKAKPPPLPATPSRAKPPPIAAPATPPRVAPPSKPLDETDEELGNTDLDHDDLDQMDEVEDEPAPDDSMRATLAALMEEENEPLPPTAAATATALETSHKVNFATLGDIAKRMKELAERKKAPEREAAAAHSRKVLEGESSGEADIRAVAESVKKQMMPSAPEPGAPAQSTEGDSIPISLTDEDEVTAASGFGTSGAASLAENKPIVGQHDDEMDVLAPATTTIPEPTERGGFPVGWLLLLILLGAAGSGYVMYGEQLLAGQLPFLAGSEPPLPAPPPTRARVDSPPPLDSDEAADPVPEATTGETEGELATGSGVDAPPELKPSGKKKRKKADDDAHVPLPDDAGERAPEEDGGEPSPEPAREPEGPAPAQPREPTAELPQRLSQNQLRDGFQKVKADAKLCGQHHQAESGTKVAVKVSIEGKTGGITKAEPQDEFARTALGKCVAEALRRATFPPFSSANMGVTWTIRL
jgi:hypothetical protein